MKNAIIVLAVFLCAVPLTACRTDINSNEIIMEIGDSCKFTKEEIIQAVEIVVDNFQFQATTLKEVSYDEEKSDKLIESYLYGGNGLTNGANKEDIIILLSEFDVDDSGDNPVLNAGSTYEDYQWILIRDSQKGEWIIDDQGY